MKNIIETKNMSVTYKNKIVLDDISVNIETGSFIFISGKSGSGKTSFVKGIIGLVPRKGEIKIDALSLKGNNSIFSYVSENANNDLECETVEEKLKRTLKNKKNKNEKISSIVSHFKIEYLLPRLITHLSEGEKQIVSIVSALIKEPKILILDEALSMIDNVTKEKIMKHLKKMNKENNCTIIYVTNNVEDSLYGTHIMLFKDGKILAFDRKEEILKNEKLYKEACIQLPFMADLSLKLKYYGLVEENILDMDKMVKHLWK